MLKDLVKFEAETPMEASDKEKLVFSKKLANIFSANLDDVIKSRAIFVVVEYLGHENTKKLIEK